MGKIERLRSITAKTKTFDYIAKGSDYISVAEWSNGEGRDISLNDKTIGISRGMLDAINFLTTAVDKSINIEYNED